MRAVLASLCLAALFACVFAATGQVTCSGANIPSPGTYSPYATIPCNWNVAVAGVLSAGTGNTFTVTGSSNVTVKFELPLGSYTASHLCPYPATYTVQIVLVMTTGSGGFTSFVRYYTTLTSTFSTMVGLVTLAPGSYKLEGGPACVSFPPTTFVTINNFGVTVTAQ